MSRHCILTESSLSLHVRKGREGKGREVGHPSIRKYRWGVATRRTWMAADAARFGGGR